MNRLLPRAMEVSLADAMGRIVSVYPADKPAVALLVRRMIAAYESEQRWPERAAAGLAALLETLAAEPARGVAAG